VLAVASVPEAPSTHVYTHRSYPVKDGISSDLYALAGPCKPDTVLESITGRRVMPHAAVNYVVACKQIGWVAKAVKYTRGPCGVSAW
jgi:hypothetical protein